jgi:hypothetical protein
MNTTDDIIIIDCIHEFIIIHEYIWYIIKVIDYVYEIIIIMNKIDLSSIWLIVFKNLS